MADEKHSQGHGEESHGGGHGGGHGGAHAGGAHEEHEGAPEWLISFADNVALMMGFFVILLAMNMKSPMAGGIGGKDKNGGAPNSSELDFVIGLRDAFNPIDMGSDDPSEAALRQRIRQRIANGTWKSRSKQPEDPGQGRESQSTRPTDLSNLGGTVPFEDDSDVLTARAKTRAQEIAARIKGQRYVVEVRGHTSPSETYRRFEKGFALSFARAKAVGEALAAAGVSWEQMRLVACGVNEPNVARDYSDADRANQRVEVVVTGDRLRDPSGAAPSAPKPGGEGAATEPPKADPEPHGG